MRELMLLGIDTGVKTGFAYSVNGVMRDISTESIISAQHRVLILKDEAIESNYDLIVCIEDVRLRKWVDPKAGRERLQGVGSVKRDCSIWQEFCEHHNLRYILVAPRNVATKTKAKPFAEVTGWMNRTSEHGRDAGMMIDKYYRLIKKGTIAIPDLPRPDETTIISDDIEGVV